MYTIEPIAFVKNERNKIEDDYWGNVISEIILSDKLSEDSLKGIEEFSHLEIIFLIPVAIKNCQRQGFLPKEKKPVPICWVRQ